MRHKCPADCSHHFPTSLTLPTSLSSTCLPLSLLSLFCCLPHSEFAAVCFKFSCWKAFIKCSSNKLCCLFIYCSLPPPSLPLLFFFVFSSVFSFCFSFFFGIFKIYAWLIIKFKLSVSFIFENNFRPLFTSAGASFIFFLLPLFFFSSTTIAEVLFVSVFPLSLLFLFSCLLLHIRN